METINVGEILKPFGIVGDLKVKPLTDDPTRFLKLRTIIIDGQTYKLKNARVDNKFAYIKLGEINSRTEAESFAGKLISIDRALAVPLPENTYFICDIMNAKVFFDDGEELGELKSVDCNGAADVFTVATIDNKVVRFPFLNKLTESVDIASKKVVIKRKDFLEVSIYED